MPPRFIYSAASSGEFVSTVFTEEVSRKAAKNAKYEESHRRDAETQRSRRNPKFLPPLRLCGNIPFLPPHAGASFPLGPPQAKIEL